MGSYEVMRGVKIVVMRGEAKVEFGERRMAEADILRRWPLRVEELDTKRLKSKAAIRNIAHLMQRVVKAAVPGQPSPRGSPVK